MTSKRENKGRLIQLEGRNVVLEALRSGRTISRIIIDSRASRGDKIGEIRNLSRKKGIDIQTGDRNELKRLSLTGSHQGVIAFATPKENITLTGLLKEIRGEREPFLVVLGEVMYEQNLGAIIRTAECSGVDGIVVPKKRSAPLSATVSRISMGASEHVPVIREGITSALSILRREGVMLFGVEADGERDWFDQDLTGASAFVFGGEDKGLTDVIRQRCDTIISIPLFGEITSLNLSVSVGIILYEKVRQETLKK